MASPGRHQRRKHTRGEPAELAAGGSEKPRISRAELGCWAVLFTAAVGALLWKHHAQFFYSWTDEQIHFYVAHRMAEGAVLYRDIDSARPPLVLLPLEWLLRLGWSPLLAGRALVLSMQLVTAGLLFWGGLRLFSWRAGALAALLFLTSPEIFDRIHYTGIHLVALTVTACALLSLRGHPLRAGLFAGLTMAADQHGLVVCGVLAVLTFLRRPRDGLRFALGALLISGMIFGGVWAMGGRHLWTSLIGIHLFHLRVGQGASAQFWGRFTPWLCEHAYLFAGAVLALALLGGKRAETSGGEARPSLKRDVRVLLLLVGAHLAVVLALTEAAFLYVVVIAPMLALLAGMGFAVTVAWWRQRRRSSQAQARRASRWIRAGAVGVLALTVGGWAVARGYRENMDKRHYSFWPHLLHGQVERLQQLDATLGRLRDSLPPRDGTIFGDPTIVSALALQSGRRVSAELVDLNPSWVEAGSVKAADVVSRIERDRVAAVITPPWGLVQDPYFKAYLFACYEKPKPVFPPESGSGAGLPFFLVFAHNSGTTLCQVPPQ